jgi:hypothetical protein
MCFVGELGAFRLLYFGSWRNPASRRDTPSINFSHQSAKSQDSSVTIAAELQAERTGFDSRQGQRSIPFATSSRPAVEPIQRRIQWVPGALSPGIKQQGHEADHSPPSSAEVKNEWSYTPTPPYVFMVGTSVPFTFTNESVRHFSAVLFSQCPLEYPGLCFTYQWGSNQGSICRESPVIYTNHIYSITAQYALTICQIFLEPKCSTLLLSTVLWLPI